MLTGKFMNVPLTEDADGFI